MHIDGKIGDLIVHPISLGIIFGLVFGKFLGISIFSKLAVRFKWASLPEGLEWRHIYGVSFLAGIGFTMSMFISDLAFKSEQYVQIAKVGILVASILSATIGMLFLLITSRKPTTENAAKS